MYEGDKTIRIYLREIGEVKLLSPREEIDLAARIKRGDESARQLMIRANLRLVVKIAQDYARYGLPLLDLISEGNIGLMKAVGRFDPKKGGKLSTYAAWWIKQAIKRALANQSKTIRLPAHLVDKIARMRRTERKLTEDLGREPTEEELAVEMNVERSTISHWTTVAIKPASLDAPISDDESGTFSEIVGDDRARSPFEEINDRQLMEEVKSLMDRLDYREREILKYRYGLQGAATETLEDVGVRFNVTRERVRQIQNQALARLRQMLEETGPRPEIANRGLFEEDIAALRDTEDARGTATAGSSPASASARVAGKPRGRKAAVAAGKPGRPRSPAARRKKPASRPPGRRPKKKKGGRT